MMVVLDGLLMEQLSEALRQAFTLERLTLMLRFRLNRNLQDSALGDDYQVIAFRLLRAAEAEGWISDLVLAARKSNPGNPTLLAVAQRMGLEPGVPDRPRLESIIVATNTFLDVNQWRTRLGEIEAQVCRIEIKRGEDMIYGTGFLVGPDVVMTNYHVIAPVMALDGPGDVVFRFDYKKLADGKTIDHGQVYRLAAKDWLINSSPPSAVDELPDPKPGLPDSDQLDYALLRLEQPIGSLPIGAGNSEPGAERRKWIEIGEDAYTFKSGAPLFIVQHPQGEPMKLALSTDGVIGLNGNGTRVTYRTNTEQGSSGSPCFSGDWKLVALHHSGDPNFAALYHPTYNQGIPLAAITKLLEQRKLKSLLGATTVI